jgi:hypothetical protein
VLLKLFVELRELNELLEGGEHPTVKADAEGDYQR